MHVVAAELDVVHQVSYNHAWKHMLKVAASSLVTLFPGLQRLVVSSQELLPITADKDSQQQRLNNAWRTATAPKQWATFSPVLIELTQCMHFSSPQTPG
jgi:hypothetical protein